MKAKSYKGVTLIELMVAMVIGMIVIVATLGLFSRTLSTNSYQAQVLRVQGFLINTMKLISRDVRRAGYTLWTSSQTLVGYASMTQPNVSIPNSGQILLAYDLDSDAGSDEMGFTYYAADKRLETCLGNCYASGTGTWVSVNDPDEIAVESFSVTELSSQTFTFASETATVRTIQITLEAGIPGNAETRRGLTEVVRIRRNEPL